MTAAKRNPEPRKGSKEAVDGTAPVASAAADDRRAVMDGFSALMPTYSGSHDRRRSRQEGPPSEWNAEVSWPGAWTASASTWRGNNTMLMNSYSPLRDEKMSVRGVVWVCFADADLP